jgi:hypothetical protein
MGANCSGICLTYLALHFTLKPIVIALPPSIAVMPNPLLKRSTCPHCWKGFAPEDVLWIATHPELYGDPRVNDYRRFLPSRFNLAGDALDARGQVCLELACPHCHLAIPKSILEVDPFFVSILGTPSCGKSVFLAAMTWELRKFMPHHFRLSFSDADARSNMTLSDYQEKLFMNPNDEELIPMADLIEKTQQTSTATYNMVNYDGKEARYPKPFYFSLAPLAGHPSLKDAARISRLICLYDNAGENYLTAAKGVNTETQHLGKAQFLLFLFDPTQDQRFLKKLQGLKPGFKGPELMRQETVLIEAADRIRKLTGMGSTVKYERPLIVVVTKLDEWEGLIPNRDSSTVWAARKDGMYVVDLDLVERQSLEIKNLLLQTTPEVVTSAESFAQKVCYIGVSALGTSPEVLPPTHPKFNPAKPTARAIRPAGIQPRNVVLPFVYGLGNSLSGPIGMKKK